MGDIGICGISKAPMYSRVGNPKLPLDVENRTYQKNKHIIFEVSLCRGWIVETNDLKLIRLAAEPQRMHFENKI